MPQITTVMITAGHKRASLIEFSAKKTVPISANNGQGPTLLDTECALAVSENRLLPMGLNPRRG
jgi:hypothetical protein